MSYNAAVDPAAIANAVVAHYGRVKRDLPWRRTRDPYAIWV
ncbi:MAG: adenine glycosylase, partial [Deltaproteobacteria bacterium]|nr:adenine glycosylase [Deltaproteobacteria bacterium]